jgi:hypothetical protein
VPAAVPRPTGAGHAGQDHQLQYGRIQLLEIENSAMCGSHCRESSKLSSQHNENLQEKQNYFAHTAICGS